MRFDTCVPGRGGEAYTVFPLGTGAVIALSSANVTAQAGGDNRNVGTLGTFAGSAKRGDVVRFTVANAWSPTCALSRVKGPDGAFIDVTQSPMTGPEGFTFAKSASGYRAQTVSRSHTESESSSRFTSQQICINASAGGSFGFGSASVSASACTGSEWRRTTDDANATSNTLGGQAETQLAFNVGVRSREVPVPAAPVGSLLAVVMPKDQRDIAQALEIRVVRETGTSVLIAGGDAAVADVDVFLMPNDVRAAGCVPASAAPLNVTASRLVPRGAAMEAAGAAMASAIARLTTASRAVEGQGRLLPQDAAYLQSLAQTELSDALAKTSPAMTLTDLPPGAKAWFDLWTTQVVRGLERTIELRGLERDRAGILAELAGIDASIAGTTGQKAGARTLAQWAIANVDDEVIATDMSDLRRLVQEYLQPLIDVRHPAIRGVLARSGGAAFVTRAARDRLLATPFTAPGIDGIRKAADFVTALQAVIAESNLDASTSVSSSTVILQLPNPFARDDVADQIADFPRITDARRDQVWNAIGGPVAAGTTAPATISVAILPQDLYASDLYGAALTCLETRPIVTAMALYAAMPDEADARIVDGIYKLSVGLDKLQTFPLESGPRTLTLAPSVGDPFGFEGRTATLKLLAGSPALAVSRLQDESSRLPGDYASASGLSPFGTVSIPTGRLRSILNASPTRLAGVQALNLAFRVQTRTTSQTLSWIPSCGATASTGF